eukprot:3517762-Heterocapsa_arctica.AAC.1
MHPIEKEGKNIKRYTRIYIGEPDQQNKDERTKTTDKPTQGAGVTGQRDYEVQQDLEEQNQYHYKRISKYEQ